MKNIIFATIFFSLNLFSNDSLKKISIQFMWHDQFKFAGFYVAKEKGFYKELGLDVGFKKFSTGINITDTVINGKADFGTNSSSLIIDKSEGKDIVLLGSVFQSSPLILLGLKNSNIKNIFDIKNKRLMLTKNQQYFATFQAMLASRGIGLEDINIIKHSSNIDDLINKKTDFMLAYATKEPFLLKEKGYEGKIFHPKDYGFDFYEEIIFTSNKFAKENPQIVQKFYEATLKGWEYAFNNIDEVTKLVFEKYNPQNKSLKSLVFEANKMKELAYTKDGKFGEITEERLRLIEHTYRILGLLKNELIIEELIYFNKDYNKDYNKEKSIQFDKNEKDFLNSIPFISMCIDPDWMPYEKLEKRAHVGISADYFKLIEKKINKKIKIIHTKSWSETLTFAKQKKCDIISLALETPSRKKYFNFTKPLLDTSLVIATDLKTSFVLTNKDLVNKKVGVTKDYAYIEILKNKYPKIEFVEYKNINQGLSAVLNGETFGYVDLLISIAHEIQKEFPTQLKISGKFDIKTDLKIATRKDTLLLTTILNKAIETISEEQKQTILNKWISVKFDRGFDYSTLYKIIGIFFILTSTFIIVYRQILLKKNNKELQRRIKEEIDKNNQKHKFITQQTKKVAMAEILENIAHQWRQPLSVISVAATGIKVKEEHNILEEDDLINAIELINENTQLLSKTIDDFSSFYKDEKVFNDFFIRDTITKALNLFKIQFDQKNIVIINNIVNFQIKSIENELIQVLINILNNSKDALVTNINDKRFIFITTYKDKNNFIIEIKDNAEGIQRRFLDKVFEPYFTTKHKSQGAGIGLYMSEQIITKHLNGSISVKNESFKYQDIKYKGACFTISLPITHNIKG